MGQAEIPWAKSKCRVPMWMGGLPSGHCGNPTFGPQLPREILWRERNWGRGDAPYCFGPCCPNHGGPKEGNPIIFQDGYTQQGRQMWCAVMPDFINLQESPAGFSGDPIAAIASLNAALSAARATGGTE